MAAKEFIVGGVDTKWSTSGNWNPAGKPSNGDTVTINAAVTAMNVDEATAAIGDTDFTGAGAGFTLSGSGSFNLDGHLTFKSGMTVTHTGGFILYNPCNLTTNGVSLAADTGGITIINTNSLSLQDDLTCGPLAVRGGTTLTTNNHNITCTTFSDASTSGNTTLTLGTSTINCTNLSFGTCTLTVTSTDHTINITSDNTTSNNFAGKAWGIVNFKSNASTSRSHAVAPGSGASFKQFNISQLTARRDCSLTFSASFSLVESSSWVGGGTAADGTMRFWIGSSTSTAQRDITFTGSSKTLTLTDVDLSCIRVKSDNSAATSLTRVGNCGGCTHTAAGGYLQNVSDPKTVYMNAASADVNWYDDIWATVSTTGTTSKNNYPLPQDTAVIDNDTFDDTGNKITIGTAVGISIGGIDASALTEAQSFYIYRMANVYGDFKLSGSGCSISGADQWTSVTFCPRTMYETLSDVLEVTTYDTDWGITGLGVTDFSGTGTVKLMNNITLTPSAGTGATVSISAGKFDLNGCTTTCRTLTSATIYTREIKDTAGGGKFVITGLTGTIMDLSVVTGCTISNAPDIDFGTGALTLSADATMYNAGGVGPWGDIYFRKHAGNFAYAVASVSFTVGAVTQETPNATYPYNKVKWKDSANAVTVSSYNATGSDADGDCYIESAVAGTPAHLTDSGGTNTFSYCTIKDMHVGGGATWDADDGTNTNVSGNEGWTWPTYNKTATVAFTISKDSSELADFVEACALALSFGTIVTETVTSGGAVYEKTVTVAMGMNASDSEVADFIRACSIAASFGLSADEVVDFVEACSVAMSVGVTADEFADLIKSCSVTWSAGTTASESADLIKICSASMSMQMTTSEVVDFAKACSAVLGIGVSVSELTDFVKACNAALGIGVTSEELADFIRQCSVSTSFSLLVSIAGLLAVRCSVGLGFTASASEIADIAKLCSVSMGMSSSDSEAADFIKICSSSLNITPQVIETALFIESLLATMTFDSASSAIKEAAAILKVCSVAFSISAATSEAAYFVKVCQALLSMASESSEIADRLLSLTASFTSSVKVSEVADFVEVCLAEMGISSRPRSLGTVEITSEAAFALAAVVTALLINPPTIGSTVPKRSFETMVESRLFETVVAKRLFELMVDKKN